VFWVKRNNPGDRRASFPRGGTRRRHCGGGGSGIFCGRFQRPGCPWPDHDPRLVLGSTKRHRGVGGAKHARLSLPPPIARSLRCPFSRRRRRGAKRVDYTVTFTGPAPAQGPCNGDPVAAGRYRLRGQVELQRHQRPTGFRFRRLGTTTTRRDPGRPLPPRDRRAGHRGGRLPSVTNAFGHGRASGDIFLHPLRDSHRPSRRVTRSPRPGRRSLHLRRHRELCRRGVSASPTPRRSPPPRPRARQRLGTSRDRSGRTASPARSTITDLTSRPRLPSGKHTITVTHSITVKHIAPQERHQSRAAPRPAATLAGTVTSTTTFPSPSRRAQRASVTWSRHQPVGSGAQARLLHL